MPPTDHSMDDRPRTARPARWWVRAFLIVMAAAMVVVFYLATRVQPYIADGTPRKEASHQTLGRPPCRFREVTDMPCPSCGMTTSFAHLVRGDIVNSVRANWVGTGLAVFCILFIPWSLVSSVRGKYLWIRNVEAALGVLVGVFTVLMLGRWGVVMLLSVFD